MNNRPKIVIIVLSCITGVLSLIRIYLIVDTSTKGVEYSILQSEIERFRKENIKLRELILLESSLWVVKQKAEKEGFVEYESVYPVR